LAPAGDAYQKPPTQKKPERAAKTSRLAFYMQAPTPLQQGGWPNYVYAARHNFANTLSLDPAHFASAEMHILAPEEGGKKVSGGHQLYTGR
jgi:hypothetical protein